MATWITHLRVAEYFLQRVPGLDAEAFATGNIAPDSGIPDEKWEKFTPDPKVTHYTTEPGCAYRSNDLAFYRQYLAPLKYQQVEPAVFSFRLGYFFHLVTDNLWYSIIGEPTKARFQQQFADNPQFISEVKEDWYGQDFRYVQSHPEALFWSVFLHAEADTAGLDFLPIHALRQRVDFIKEYYQRTDEEITTQTQRPMVYLSTGEMDAFVARASETLLAIYQVLWIDNLEIGNNISALELLPDGHTKFSYL